MLVIWKDSKSSMQIFVDEKTSASIESFFHGNNFKSECYAYYFEGRNKNHPEKFNLNINFSENESNLEFFDNCITINTEDERDGIFFNELKHMYDKGVFTGGEWGIPVAYKNTDLDVYFVMFDKIKSHEWSGALDEAK